MSPLGAAAGKIFRTSSGDIVIPPPVTTPTGDFTLVGNPSFDPDDPILKNGQLLTGTALQVWNGIRWLIENHEERYVEDGGGTTDHTGNLNRLAARDDVYYLGRTLGTIYGDLFVIFRLTGWLVILDEICRIARLTATQIAKGYDTSLTSSSTRWPRHDYRCLRSGDNVGMFNGTDQHYQDSPRAHEPLFHLLYALRLNQHLTSPSSSSSPRALRMPGSSSTALVTYEEVADYWESYLRDYIRVWRGPEQALGVDENGDPASGWAANYRGQTHRYYKVASKTGDTFTRAGTNSELAWPMLSRHHMHSHVGASAMHYWMGVTFEENDSDFAGVTDMAIHGIRELVFRRNLFQIDTDVGDTYYGTGLVFPRSLHDTGHGQTNTSGGPGNYAEGSLYTGYTIHNLVNMWLDGALPTFPTEFASGVVRTFNRWLFRNLSSSQGMHISALQDLSFTGSDSPVRWDGATLPFVSSVGQPGTSALPRSNHNLLSWGGNLLMPWDTDDNHFESHVWGQLGFGGNYGRMGSSSTFRDSGGTPLSRPRVLGPSVGLLMKLVGANEWSIGED